MIFSMSLKATASGVTAFFAVSDISLLRSSSLRWGRKTGDPGPAPRRAEKVQRNSVSIDTDPETTFFLP
jgi:hypothetical protein